MDWLDFDKIKKGKSNIRILPPYPSVHSKKDIFILDHMSLIGDPKKYKKDPITDVMKIMSQMRRKIKRKSKIKKILA